MKVSESLAHWWSRRTHSERRTLAVGTLLLCALLLYGWAWRPMTADLERMDSQLPRLRAQAARMEQAGTELEKLRSRPPAGIVDASQMPALLERTAAAAGLANGSYAYDAGNRRTKVTFDRVGFPAWTAWIDQLHRTHRLVLVSVRIQPSSSPGDVRAECEFVSAAGDK